MDLRVECYAGYRGEESPRRIWLGERQVTVVEILDRWLAPDHRYFKLLGDDNGIYLIRHDSRTGGWEMTQYRQAERSG